MFRGWDKLTRVEWDDGGEGGILKGFIHCQGSDHPRPRNWPWCRVLIPHWLRRRPGRRYPDLRKRRCMVASFMIVWWSGKRGAWRIGRTWRIAIRIRHGGRTPVEEGLRVSVKHSETATLLETYKTSEWPCRLGAGSFDARRCKG